ncbi:MAG: hypothetical protein U0353_13765 [Sandaracinus sp.]
MTTLAPCPGCSRHVRRTASSCPFCATSLCASAGVAESEDARPTSRSAVMFGAAVGAIAISTALLGSACAAYGGPTPDAAAQQDAGPSR